LTVRAAANKTPQPSPVYHAAVQQAQTQEEQQRIQDYLGTPERLKTLWAECLRGDRHRCVITRAFNVTEAKDRLDQDSAKDDDGYPLDASNQYANLEAAHIIPFGLVKGENSELF
jgi:hypothetical protein